MAPILDIRGLMKRFRTGIFQKDHAITALAGVDLTIESGDTLGLVGESGCGKTTLARCVLRLIAPDEGSVFFDGCDLLRLPPAELRARRREFQLIFQDAFASLDPRMTVREIMAEPFEIHGLLDRSGRERRALELLRSVGLDGGLLPRRPAELSGGQQQRVAIARALALQPRLLVADEPVTALDPSVQAQVLNLLAELRKPFALTLILISHSLPMIRYLCTRVCVMYLGRIVEEAPADEFFRAPRHPYSQALLESTPAMEQDGGRKKTILPGDVPSPISPPRGCPFHPRCARAMAECRVEPPRLKACENSKVACFLYT
jgi:oligopeptide/dipeptide ABC transporter ATP-binding protein